jgi:hypothetical protein
METNFVVYKMLGSETHTTSFYSAKDSFEKCLDATLLSENGKIVMSREHKRVGSIHTGIRFMGNIKILECSDNKQLITLLGEKMEDCFNRIKAIEKNRNGETFYFEL